MNVDQLGHLITRIINDEVLDDCELFFVFSALKKFDSSGSVDQQIYENVKNCVLPAIHHVVKQYYNHRKFLSHAQYFEIFECLLGVLEIHDLVKTVCVIVEIVQNELLDKKLENFQEDGASKDLNLQCLRILNSTLTILKSKKVNKVSSKEYSKILFNDLQLRMLDMAIQSSDKTFTSIILSIFCKWSDITGENEILQKLWDKLKLCTETTCKGDEINNFKIHGTYCLISKLTTLCALSDYYLSVTKSQNVFIVFSNEFWHIILCGSLSNDLSLRKQSIYLCKRAIDCVNVHILSVNADLFVYNIEDALNIKNTWEDIIVLLETLEEKQVHLVTPILPLILKIFDRYSAGGTCLIKEQWLFCVCHRVFCHESVTIVKWGILNLLPSLLVDWSKMYYQLQRTILEALNSSSLYLNHCNSVTNNYEDVSKMILSIESWLTGIASKEDNIKIQFFRYLVIHLQNISWAPVPLFYIVRIISKLPNIKCLNSLMLNKLHNFIQNALRTQNICIRGAIQCLLLDCIIKLTAVEQVDDMHVISDLLSVFKKEECLRSGTLTWDKVVNWLKESYTKEQMEGFLTGFINSLVNNEARDHNGGFARMTVMIYDTNTLSDNTFDHIFSNLSELLKDCYIRSYLNVNVLNNALTYVSGIFSELNTSQCDLKTHIKRQKDFKIFIEKVILFAVDVTVFIRCSLSDRLNKDYDLDSFNIYFNILNDFTANNKIFALIENHIVNIIEDSYVVLNDLNVPPMKLYFSLRIICWYCSVVNTNKALSSTIISTLNSKFVKCINIIVKSISHTEDGDKLSRSVENKNKIKNILAGTIKCYWSLLCYYLEAGEITCNTKYSTVFGSEEFNLLDCGTKAIDVGGRETVLYVNKAFRILLPITIEKRVYKVEDVVRFISLSWESCFELRKLDLFWKVFASWLAMVFQRNFILESEYRIHIIQYIDVIVKKSDSVSRLFHALVSHMYDNVDIKDPDVLNCLMEFILRALVYGPVHRKDLRIENETCQYIKSCGRVFSINELKPPKTSFEEDCEVRWKVLDLVITSCVSYEDAIGFKCTNKGLKLLQGIVERLINVDQDISGRKLRYFNDSMHHRVKTRILQAIIILHHVMVQVYESLKNRDQCLNLDVINLFNENIFIWVCENISKESQQPSVRYMLEWLLIRCVLASQTGGDKVHQLSVESFWKSFKKGSAERAGSMCSFISVAYHLAVLFSHESFTDRCVQEILPWCMAQNFNIRLYAQVALVKLFDLYAKSGGMPVKYQVIKESVMSSMKQGSLIRNVPKLISSFYFCSFHPIHNFSLKSVLIDLPRVTGISSDEWLFANDDLISTCFAYTLSIPLIQMLDTTLVSGISLKPLSQCKPEMWLTKIREMSNHEDCDNNDEAKSTFVQKKFVPWRDMQRELTEQLGLYGAHESKDLTITYNRSDVNASSESLIVVASLIDRPPNLGGLARTCEVFGASQLVLNNLHHIEDKQFTSLSMSSEKHINITEVKAFDLKNYLMTMKSTQNYTVVGAEQTTSSTKLNEFIFPAKTLLVLGNEKEGIPANLLPVVDVCVEVPQLGVVRSLNVHVTGALIIWEYVKQHKHQKVAISCT